MPVLPVGKIPERSMRDVYFVLFRHKWKIILFFLAVVMAVAVLTWLSPEIYQSEAKLLIRMGRESVTLDPTAATGQIVANVVQQRENEVKSELEILNSRDLIERVVDAIGPDVFLKAPEEINGKHSGPGRHTGGSIGQIPGDLLAAVKKPLAGLFNRLSNRDRAILAVTKSLGIEALKNSDIITISYEAKSRKLAQETIRQLIAFYLDKHIDVHNTPGSYEFFTQETDQLRDSLDKTEANLKDLKNRTGIASLDDQRHILLSRIGDLQRELEATEANLATSKARVSALEKTLARLPKTLVLQQTTGYPNQGADLMRPKLYELELKEQDLLSRYTETSQPVQEIRRQIKEARSLLGKEERNRTQVTEGLNEASKKVEVDLLAERANASSLQARANSLRSQLASSRGELKTMNDNELSFAETQRQVAVQEATYKKSLERLEQARIDHALEMVKISNISIVQPPSYPVKPIRPRKALNMALGLFLGIIGGIGLAFASEYVDHTLKRPEDVEEKLKLSVLAAIPAMKLDPAANGADEQRKEGT